MGTQTKGSIQVILSSIIYGFTPILVKITFSGGSNGITASFLRGLFSILILLPLLYARHRRERVPGRLLFKALVAGIFGNGATTILLYMSYCYISVGMTTTIHFIYPAVTAIFSAILFRNRLHAKAILALILSMTGVALLADGGFSFDIRGVVLAACSGLTYSFYIIYISKSELRELPDLILALFVNLSLTMEAMLYGIMTKQLSLTLTPSAWLISIVVALLASVVAQVLFQSGNKIIGAPSAAIISVLEPVTSVLMGIVFLKEIITAKAGIGCACVLFGIVLVSMPAREDVCHEE